jgi:exonuclease SbcD
MKIIHTADWHLGKIIYSVHLTEEQEFILNQFVDYIESNPVDALIISGDIFDRSIPPAEAVELFNKIFTKISIDLKIPVFMIAGNHDGPERLENLNGILSAMNFFIEGKFKEKVKKVSLKDEYGVVNFFMLPYVETSYIKQFDENISSKTDALKFLINNMEINENERNILIGHEFVLGGIESDSERPLSLGGTEFVDASVFDVFDYVALGHLHKTQSFKSKKINYSGSLLKYSFNEVNQEKGMNLITINEKNNITIEKISFTPKRDMKIIEGYFDEIIQKEVIEDYLLIKLKDEKTIYDAIGRLNKKFPNVLALEFPKIDSVYNRSLEDVKSINPIEIFESFYNDVKNTELTSGQKEISKIIFEEALKK